MTDEEEFARAKARRQALLDLLEPDDVLIVREREPRLLTHVDDGSGYTEDVMSAGVFRRRAASFMLRYKFRDHIVRNAADAIGYVAREGSLLARLIDELIAERRKSAELAEQLAALRGEGDHHKCPP